ncbi:UbiA family prenyltransferase [Streptomyces panacea]|uniref:UbiA family prenyltransferase n=1 Tax=Streptomyces panacea TaxID=3035064 RepID=UPI00339BB911
MTLGPVRWISVGPGRLARRLAALSESESGKYVQYEPDPPPRDAPHQPPRADPRGSTGQGLRAWAELLRVSALFTVPGDALAGAASAGVRPNRGTALAVGASLCLYEAGMALNDWADRDEDAVERPHRPIPSGRITPNAALTAAGALTATGLLLASRAGRPALALSTALAATVWAYDIRLKHTAAGPAAMGAARALDVLLGATATHSASRRAPAPPPPRASKAGRTLAAARQAMEATTPTSRRTTPPARRGVLARLSAWAGGSTAGRTPPAPAPRGRTAPVETVASRLIGTATEATASTARYSPPAGRDVLSRLSAWADGSSQPGDFTTPSGRTSIVGRSGGSVLRGRTTIRAGGPMEPLASRSAAPAAGSGPAPGLRAVPSGALVPAALLGVHTLAVTTVSRREVYGGSVGAPLAALAVTGALGALVGLARTDAGPPGLVTPALAAAFVVTAGTPFLHAALNPSPQLTQRAVGGGIRAMIPFQAALAARGGAPGIGLAVMGLVPLARKLAKKVSVT